MEFTSLFMGKSANMPEDASHNCSAIEGGHDETILGRGRGHLAGLPAFASDDDLMMVESSSDVATTMDRLEAAVTEAGANVMARVDHAAGAASVDMELAPTQVLIFGNPKIGTQAMQDDPRAGLFLPMKVLVYEDGEGQTGLPIRIPKRCSTISRSMMTPNTSR